MTEPRRHDEDSERAGQLVPTRLYPGAEIQWVRAREPLGKPRPGHGTLYVNPAADLPDSEWCASWEDDYPKSDVEAHGGATAGIDSISGSEEVVLRWARTSPAQKHLILQRGKWVRMPLDENLDERSHGEGFLIIFQTMFNTPGLYLMDEPEAALSFRSCLRLVTLIHELGQTGAQVICATHSPIVASVPGADVIEVGEHGYRRSKWSDLDLTDDWRRYLADPDIYLARSLEATGT